MGSDRPAKDWRTGELRTDRCGITSTSTGIGMVHQHVNLVAELTMWENVVLGERDRRNRRRGSQ